MLGLFGMLGVVLGARRDGTPRDDLAVTSVEGWILGLDPADVDVPGIEPAPPPRGPRFVVARNPKPALDPAVPAVAARPRWPSPADGA